MLKPFQKQKRFKKIAYICSDKSTILGVKTFWFSSNSAFRQFEEFCTCFLIWKILSFLISVSGIYCHNNSVWQTAPIPYWYTIATYSAQEFEVQRCRLGGSGLNWACSRVWESAVDELALGWDDWALLHTPPFCLWQAS